MFGKVSRIVLFVIIMITMLTACAPSVSSTPEIVQATAMPAANGFQDMPALPNDSGIEGVQTFPDKSEYHKHVSTVTDPKGDVPPVFGEHYPAWQNCGIYNKPVELGSALHSMEHGAVWLTYRPDLSDAEITDLQSLVRGHGFVLMSPYASQAKPVVLTAWGVQLVIDSLPDDRIAKFIAYYEQGPQNPEPGASCSNALGSPLP
jgi:hypothetical protein